MCSKALTLCARKLSRFALKVHEPNASLNEKPDFFFFFRAYDPAEYENLPVSSEIKELFQYITRYTPQTIDLEHKLKPFIPDYIPAVGDIDAFIKVRQNLSVGRAVCFVCPCKIDVVGVCLGRNCTCGDFCFYIVQSISVNEIGHKYRPIEHIV